jgi:hypothetical protein
MKLALNGASFCFAWRVSAVRRRDAMHRPLLGNRMDRATYASPLHNTRTALLCRFRDYVSLEALDDYFV